MDLVVHEDGDSVRLSVSGRVDSVTAPELESSLAEYIKCGKRTVVDLAGTRYVSSAGLRVFLRAQKALLKNGASLCIAHPNDLVMEVFEATGLAELLSIE